MHEERGVVGLPGTFIVAHTAGEYIAYVPY